MFRKALIKHTHNHEFKHDKSLKQFKVQTFNMWTFTYYYKYIFSESHN